MKTTRPYIVGHDAEGPVLSLWYLAWRLVLQGWDRLIVMLGGKSRFVR